MLHAKDGNISVSIDVFYLELTPARRHQRSCAQAWPSNLPWQGTSCRSLHCFIGQATSFTIIYPTILARHFIECYYRQNCQSGKVKQAVLTEAQAEWKMGLNEMGKNRSEYHKPARIVYFFVNLIHIWWCTVINIKFLSRYKYLKCGGSLLITKYTGHSERLDDLNTCTPSVFKSRDIFIGLLKNPPSTMWIR